MGFFGLGSKRKLFGTESISDKDREDINWIVTHVSDFVDMCYKIGMKGKGRCAYPIIADYKTDGSLTKIWCNYVIHDDDHFDLAYECVKRGDIRSARLLYDDIVRDYELLPRELRSFQDASDFVDLLRGGIPGYNICARNGNDIEITQLCGSFVESRTVRKVAFDEIDKVCKAKYPYATTTRFGETSWSIKL